jgi:zinc protease
MTVEDIKRLASQYIRPDQMIYLVVGDAETQMARLEQLGFGSPVLLNEK